MPCIVLFFIKDISSLNIYENYCYLLVNKVTFCFILFETLNIYIYLLDRELFLLLELLLMLLLGAGILLLLLLLTTSGWDVVTSATGLDAGGGAVAMPAGPYWWHGGGFHTDPPANILNFSVFHFCGESP